MIGYFDELLPEEQAELTDIIRLLYRQTFILERKYDRKTGRYQYNKDFRVCNKHLEFIREYLKIAGIEVRESSQLGVIYMQGEGVVGDKLPRLATLYLLVLKLIYDEQMASVSNSVHIITTLSEIHEKLGNNLGLLAKKPAPTDIRRTLTLLKKYQVIEPLDMMEGADPQTRMIIYPSINVVLFGEEVRGLLASFDEERDAAEDGDGTVLPDGQKEPEAMDDDVEGGDNDGETAL